MEVAVWCYDSGLVFVLTFTIIAALFTLSYLLSGKALFHPACLFCLAWGINLLVIAASGHFFYPLHAQTLLILILGCVSFAAGAAAWDVTHALPPSVQPKARKRLLTVSVLIVVIATPLLARWLFNLVSDVGAVSLLNASRNTMLDIFVTRQFPVVTNLFTFSTIIALIAFNERPTRPRLWIAAVACALFLNLITGRRMGVIAPVISLLCLDYLQTRKVRWKAIAVAGGLAILIMGGVAIYAGIGSVNTEDSIIENLHPVLEGLALYESGGTMVMDQLISYPHLATTPVSAIDSLRSVVHASARVDVVPESNFVVIGPFNLQDNVATIYSAYAFFGSWSIAVLLMCPLGTVSTLFYRRALAGWPISRLIYSCLFAAIVLSPFADEFASGMNFIPKMIAVAWFIYPRPRSISHCPGQR